MMFSVEIAVVAAILLCLVGIERAIYYGHATKLSIALLTGSLLLGAWIVTAAFTDRPVVNVTYHPIAQHTLPDGTVIDVMAFWDEIGRAHVVNINSALGLKIPTDGQSYQIARVKYSRSAWGLKFGKRHKYRVVRSLRFP